MTAISNTTFKFLKDLRKNNNRDWFQANKGRYLEAKDEFDVFMIDLLGKMSTYDPELKSIKPADCIFRIYRDVRFSKDKSPYKTHLGAYIAPGGKKTEVHRKAGYYVHVEPGACMLAGGAYEPDGVWLKAIRQEIDYNSSEFKKILNTAAFKKYFGGLSGEQLSRPPQGYSKEHPMIEFLRNKSFLAVHECGDKIALASDFLKHATAVFKAMQPLNQFLNRSMH